MGDCDCQNCWDCRWFGDDCDACCCCGECDACTCCCDPDVDFCPTDGCICCCCFYAPADSCNCVCRSSSSSRDCCYLCAGMTLCDIIAATLCSKMETKQQVADRNTKQREREEKSQLGKSRAARCTAAREGGRPKIWRRRRRQTPTVNQAPMVVTMGEGPPVPVPVFTAATTTKPTDK